MTLLESIPFSKSFESFFCDATGISTQAISNVNSLSGGCINSVFSIKAKQDIFCVKVNIGNIAADAFKKEAEGLDALRKTQTISVPKVYKANSRFILMSYIKYGLPSKRYWENLGAGIASLHRHQGQACGWKQNNYIGSLLQENTFVENSVSFFIDFRLSPQLLIAQKRDAIPNSTRLLFDRLFKELPNLIPHLEPSFLHGDLWSGNIMSGEKNAAWVIDPAVYYGSRESEIAFTKLFGGFSKTFYDSYHHAFPLDKEFYERIDIYNLYPLLVHLNLFGSSYLSAIQQTLNRFV